MNKDVGKTLLLALAVGLGAILAFGFYAALKPSVEVIVQPIERQQQHLADSVARARAAERLLKQRATALAPASPRPLASTTPLAAPRDTQPRANASLPRGRATHLPLAVEEPGRGRGWWGLLGLGLAGAAAAWAFWEARHRLQLPVPTSRVLEALLTLKPHQDLMKKSLSPRQIKRFNSQARVQHRQLTALAQLQAGFRFAVEQQLLAFQVLLLLEEDREGPQSLLNASQSEFIAHLEQAYAARDDLAAARQQARQLADIAAALAREAPVAPLTPGEHHQLLAQLHELNAGLLA